MCTDSAGVSTVGDGYILDCIDGHGNVYPTFAVVPLEIDAVLDIASPILNNFVRFSM
jgi:hypothetical protein